MHAQGTSHVAIFLTLELARSMPVSNFCKHCDSGIHVLGAILLPKASEWNRGMVLPRPKKSSSRTLGEYTEQKQARQLIRSHFLAGTWCCLHMCLAEIMIRNNEQQHEPKRSGSHCETMFVLAGWPSEDSMGAPHQAPRPL